MSNLNVEVIQLDVIDKHPNADTLSLAKVWGYTCIIRTQDFNVGDLAAYIPVDTVVGDQPEFVHLGTKKRIRALRLRGIYSEGLLVKARPHWELGMNVAEELGCSKYEPPEQMTTGGENESQPNWFHLYTDIESYKRFRHLIKDGEEVVCIEKIHGCCSRYSWKDNRLWVGSHRNTKRFDDKNLWWKVAEKNSLQPIAKRAEGFILFGETYGANVQDLKYQAKRPNDLFFGIFDIYDIANHKYLDWEDFLVKCQEWSIPESMLLPIIYRGPWSPDIMKLAEGRSLVPGADCVREGFVVRPTKERWNSETHRTILKVVGEGYRLRKGGTEKH